MTIAPADTPVYTDLKGLSSLKRGAAMKDPAAIRKVAQQFESMFTRMMLKSMRDAVGTDPMFGSDQQKMYQEMADDQLSVQLSKGKGLGLADMLMRQLQKLGVKGADAALQSNVPAGSGGRLPGAAAAAAYSTTQHTVAGPPASDPVKADFINGLWPHAQQAGEQLGVDPRNLIAQAALETNWGRSFPQDPSGRSSHNLFGVKASGDWTGATVSSGTQEFHSGVASAINAQFRAYASPQQSFQDYVALLRGNPRYAAALNTGADVRAFAAGLQRGGYATDPDYARKVTAIAQTIGNPASGAPGRGELKLAEAEPITVQDRAL